MIRFPRTCPDTEYSVPFLQGMIDRVGVSFHKYGSVTEGFPDKVDAIKSLELRIEKYIETGNTEWLMDVANYAMIEFLRPRKRGQKRLFFKPTSAADSPGRVHTDGETSQRANDGGMQTPEVPAGIAFKETPA